MKKMLFSLLIICIILTSCAQKSEIPAEPEKTPVTENKPVISEAYKEIVNNKRPLAVMIDNDDKSARPQTGLEKAYIVCPYVDMDRCEYMLFQPYHLPCL